MPVVGRRSNVSLLARAWMPGMSSPRGLYHSNSSGESSKHLDTTRHHRSSAIEPIMMTNSMIF